MLLSFRVYGKFNQRSPNHGILAQPMDLMPRLYEVNTRNYSVLFLIYYECSMDKQFNPYL